MKKIKPFFMIMITFIVILLFYIKRLVILKFYPPICNFSIFMIFFISLFTKETIIQKFAKLAGDKLSEAAINYTRKITYVWCIFTFINFIFSVITIFLPDKIWILYNGCISYLLVGLLFTIEYIIRINLQKRNII